MPNIATVNKRVDGVCHHPSHDGPFATGGTITSGSSTFTVDGERVAVIGDTVTSDCGHIGYIVSGASQFTAVGERVARVGDLVDGVYRGTITTGVNTFSIGD